MGSSSSNCGASHNKSYLKCNAECDRDTSHEKEFSEEDLFYSNQGKSGTCVRHAIAKAVQFDMQWTFKSKHKLHTSALVSFLVNSIRKGADGCWPLEFDNVKGQVIGHKGEVFEIHLQVGKDKFNYSGQGHGYGTKHYVGRVFVLELAKIYDNWKPGHDLHAVFCQDSRRTGTGMEYVLRNSWGSHREYIKIRAKEAKAVHSIFYVTILHLILKGYKEPDTVLMDFRDGKCYVKHY
jgi:hypothetical protein